MENNITKKLTKITLETRTFIPEGGQPVEYKRVVLHFIYGGNVKKIELGIKPDAALVLDTLPETEDFIPQNNPDTVPTNQ